MDFKPNEFFRGLEEFITILLPGGPAAVCIRPAAACALSK